MNLEDLVDKIKNVPGIIGRFVDIRRGRGDKIEVDSTQIIMRFYQDPNKHFNPPQYIHFNDK